MTYTVYKIYIISVDSMSVWWAHRARQLKRTWIRTVKSRTQSQINVNQDRKSPVRLPNTQFVPEIFGMSPAVSSNISWTLNNTEHNYVSCGFRIVDLALVQFHLTSSRTQHVTTCYRNGHELVVIPTGL